MQTIIHKHLIGTNESASPPSSPTPHPSSLTRQRWLKIATGDIDRAGDILVIAGMDAENFLKNPQFLWQHGASGSLISTIGRVLELRVVSGDPAAHSAPIKGAGVGAHHAGLFALVEYAPAEISPLAEQVYQLDIAGLMPANSIGFRPIEYEANSFGGHTFTKWELVECSKVELPMNPDAVDSQKSYSLEEATNWLLS
jgi:hypothetical protein